MKGFKRESEEQNKKEKGNPRLPAVFEYVKRWFIHSSDLFVVNEN